MTRSRALGLGDIGYIRTRNIPDPNFGSVVFLGHFDDTNYVDSTGRHALSGTTGVTNVSGQFGNAAQSASGANGLRYVNGNTDFGFGTADFTIEWTAHHFNAAAGAAQIMIGFHNPGSSVTWQIAIENTVDGKIKFYHGSYILSSAVAPSNNTTYQYGISRVGSSLGFYIDGTRVDHNTSPPSIANPSEALGIGGASNSSNYGFDGWIDEVRITSGVGRFTGPSYTPPGSPFSDS